MRLRIIFAVVVLSGVLLHAQTIGNPSAVTFTASPDHAVVLADGTPLVDHYDVTVMLASPGSTLVFTQGIGKPAPDASNTISVPVSSLTGWNLLAKNTPYQMQVAAVNSAGFGASIPDPFALLGTPRAPGKPVVK